MEQIDRLFREDRDRILATLIGLLGGDFDLAEEMMQEAFLAALHHWPVEGCPENPRAWLVSTARHKAIDRIRRESRRRELLADAPRFAVGDMPMAIDDQQFHDDRLRLMFTCCHPSLPLDGQVALTLRTLCGLTTEEIARMFLVPAATMAQRLVRVKHKIAAARIPYRIPPADLLPERLDAVLTTVYLIFTEGYAATGGEALIRGDLCTEAIRLGRLLIALLPERPEPMALTALMLLHHCRRSARLDHNGEIQLLEQQDRSRWNAAEIAEGLDSLERSLRNGGGRSRYAIEAAIAAVHVQAPCHEQTDWQQISALYGRLMALHPSPVVALNRAVAVAMAEGAEAGLQLMEELERKETLRNYHLLPAAQAELLRRLGRYGEAAKYYRCAIALAGNGAERRFLEKALAALGCDSLDSES
jgi:RNA polymerase sigma-70 factor (ECF subfamily)